MKILCDLAAQFGITLLVSLHQTEVAKQFCSRVIALRQGELVLDSLTTELSETVLRNLYGVNAEEFLTTSSGGFDVVDSEVLSVA
jgi:phosphonate transport system ATP-binding protein